MPLSELPGDDYDKPTALRTYPLYILLHGGGKKKKSHRHIKYQVDVTYIGIYMYLFYDTHLISET
jgi:hypothetical protein